MDNREKLINALNSVRRIHKLWYKTKCPIVEISFTIAIKDCEAAKAYSSAVKLRAMENFFVTNEHETNERFNRIINELQDLVNAQKTHKSNTARNRALVGNASADKRIND